jgi:hypothetical protein
MFCPFPATTMVPTLETQETPNETETNKAKSRIYCFFDVRKKKKKKKSRNEKKKTGKEDATQQ